MECLLSDYLGSSIYMNGVLILILMECLLRNSSRLEARKQSCLNPYSNGMLT